MKIKSITKKGDVYTINYVPSFIEKLIGIRKKEAKYKYVGCCYLHFPTIKVFIDYEGKIIGHANKITKELMKYDNKLTWYEND